MTERRSIEARSRRGFPGILLATLALFAGGASRAHEMGAMKVAATFAADGTYRIDISVAAEHLPAGLSPFPGLAETYGAAPSEQEQAEKLAEFRRLFLEKTRIAFDGTTVEPEEETEPPGGPSASGEVTFHLKGRVPRGAKTFSWTHEMLVGAYLLTLQSDGDERPAYQWLEGGRASRPYPLRHATAPLSRWEVVRLYLALGFTHIVPRGLDHILFVLGLYLLSLKRRTILLQVTAFTVAHSITLGLTIYGVVSLSPRIVEPLIALSIVYVAVENLFVAEFKPWRLAIVFGFGLLHGMGFAGVLRELGLPRSEFIPALISFNVGVEAGQLTVIAAAFLLCGAWFGSKPWYRARITRPASALIALVGAYWTVQRVFF